MTSADVNSTTSAEMPAPATAEENLEVVTLNVTDIDRAKGFYQNLGWRLDADFGHRRRLPDRAVHAAPTRSARFTSARASPRPGPGARSG